MAKLSNLEKGKIAEELATDFLIAKGYDILELNWRYRKSEIDIIATDQSKLIFIEVKSRGYNTLGSPEVSINPKKKSMLFAGASAYIRLHNYKKDIRFDIISIVYRSEDDFDLSHFEDAFFPV